VFDTKSVGDLPLAVEKRYSLGYLEDIGKTPIIHCEDFVKKYFNL
jgi:hypothetical protein